jgi:hypothetical protein
MSKRIHLCSRYDLNAIDEPLLRRTAVALGSFATNAAVGRVRGDPVFDEITEKRAYYPKYSSCGDLCHWLLYRLGVRNESLVNRSGDGGHQAWKMGKNVSMLVYESGQAWVKATTNRTPCPGDILCMTFSQAARTAHGWDGTHVCVVESFDGGTLRSFDYGQYDAVRGLPAGKRVCRTFKTGWCFGERYVLGWIDLMALTYADCALVPDDFEGGIPEVILEEQAAG